MTIRLVEKGRPRLIALIVALACALPQVFFPRFLPKDYPVIYPMLLAIVMFVYVLMVFGLRFEVKSWWSMILEQMCVAGIAAVVIHLPMYANSGATIRAMLFSWFIMLVPLFLALAVTGNGKWFSAVLMTVCWGYGIINFEVFEFTQNMISVGQILSVRTGINVMSNYHFVMGPYVLSSTIIYVCSMIALFRIKDTGMQRAAVRVTALVCAALSTIMPIYGYIKMPVRNWRANALYQGVGIPLELLLEIKTYKIQMPEGYSTESASKLVEYASAEPDVQIEKRPHVIAIMIEAFSDLTVLGDLQLNMDPIPYTHALSDESIHGYYLASTYAGGTSRTEWEFLTGNSMFNVPNDSIPFKQYVSGEQNSIVKQFENAGYHTIGMHNFDGSGWNRNTVYPLMGFDDIYFDSDLEWDGGNVRDYISDKAFMRQVIRLFEEHQAKQTGEPLFFFGVTMQNHGDYRDKTFQSDVHVTNLDMNCFCVDQYLSLTKLSDNAIKELIEYFRSVDEPVEIVLFGDHQPNMPNELYTEVGMEQFGQRYLVPYVIWKNYDNTARETPLTSANLISVCAVREAGLTMSPYYRFLDKLSETIPSICGLGYQYNGAFYGRDEAADDKVAKLLSEYRNYQYANMFDTKVDPALFQGKRSE